MKREFQLTSFEENSNKMWRIDYDPLTGASQPVTTTWGRVGSGQQSKTKTMYRTQAEKLIKEKLDKGYHEVILHMVEPVVFDVGLPSNIGPQVQGFLELIFAEAGEAVSGYLAQSVDALSIDQINAGRRVLDVASKAYNSGLGHGLVEDAVRDYYNIIPTVLPRNIRDKAAIVRDFCADFSVHENRLDQLEAALATYQYSGQVIDLYGKLGAIIKPATREVCQGIEYGIHDTTMHGYRINIHDIFEVEVPSERKAFNDSSYPPGSPIATTLFHGTNNANIRHILHEKGPGSGLRVPRNLTNGWAFGPGIYFADKSSKSANYCESTRGRKKVLLLADVYLGNKYEVASGKHFTQAPEGYHSVMGVAGKGYLRYNEYIVYRASQQSIKYAVTWS